MNDQTITILIVALIVVGGAIAGWLLMQRRKTSELRERFGDEYDRTLEERGGRSKAEADLLEREKRVAELEIRKLTPAEHDRYVADWTATKALFVDDPKAAVGKADTLLTDVMKTRGYKVSDFEHQHADLTVEHADVAKHYLAGHKLCERSEAGEASTEDLRQAINHYEALFDRLVDDIATPDEDVTVRGSKLDEVPPPPKAAVDTDAPRPNPTLGDEVVIDRDANADGTVTTTTERTSG